MLLSAPWCYAVNYHRHDFNFHIHEYTNYFWYPQITLTYVWKKKWNFQITLFTLHSYFYCSKSHLISTLAVSYLRHTQYFPYHLPNLMGGSIVTFNEIKHLYSKPVVLPTLCTRSHTHTQSHLRVPHVIELWPLSKSCRSFLAN